jgi:RNA polymerase sigma factor (TIGR02999 family)
MDSSEKPITQLLESWRSGNQSAADQLIPLVYDQLRAVAGRLLRSEHKGHTLSATAVVHEAYMRMVDAEVDYQHRAHFFAVASRAMRRLLVDHAKSKRRVKRGGEGARRVTLDDALAVGGSDSHIQDLDEALTRLAAIDERKARIIELAYFGGLTQQEMAVALDISESTVLRELKLAKAWIHHELQNSTEPQA